jgi:PKD repeat protein
MKKHNKHIFWTFSAAIALVGLVVFFGCKKEATLKLGTTPTPDFAATVGSDGHTVTLVNKSSTASIPYWAAPDVNLGYGDLQGDSAKVNFIFPGTYTIKMLVVGQGGLDSLTKTVTTTQPDPNACSATTALGFLASCTQKTWTLNPAAGAFAVGQYAGDGGWWTSGAAQVTERPCLFNDEYTFKFNKAGDFIYNDHGDFWTDGGTGWPGAAGCYADSQYSAGQQAWGSGNFHYVIIPGAGVKGLGQIKLIGFGAHFALQKPINGNDAPNVVTANSVTYDIWSMQRNLTDGGGTYDLLVVTLHYGNWSPTDGWWTYTFISRH